MESINSERILKVGGAFKAIYYLIIIELIWMPLFGLLRNNPQWFISFDYDNIRSESELKPISKYLEKLENVNQIFQFIILIIILSQLKSIYTNLLLCKKSLDEKQTGFSTEDGDMKRGVLVVSGIIILILALYFYFKN